MHALADASNDVRIRQRPKFVTFSWFDRLTTNGKWVAVGVTVTWCMTLRVCPYGLYTQSVA